MANQRSYSINQASTMSVLLLDSTLAGWNICNKTKHLHGMGVKHTSSMECKRMCFKKKVHMHCMHLIAIAIPHGFSFQ